MMVGERVGHELEPQRLQRREKAPGIADARDGVQSPAPQRRERHVLPGPADAPKAVRRKAHLECAATRRPVHDDRVHLAPGRLAQRTRREQQAVAVAALVLDRDLEVARERVVLEPVVA